MSKREVIREIKRDLEDKSDYITFKYETVKEIYKLLKKQDKLIDDITSFIYYWKKISSIIDR